MSEDEVVRAIETKQPVRLRYAPREMAALTHAEGRIIGFCDAPMVCVETDDGKHVWWRRDLSEVIETCPARETLHLHSRSRVLTCTLPAEHTGSHRDPDGSSWSAATVRVD